MRISQAKAKAAQMAAPKTCTLCCILSFCQLGVRDTTIRYTGAKNPQHWYGLSVPTSIIGGINSIADTKVTTDHTGCCAIISDHFDEYAE